MDESISSSLITPFIFFFVLLGLRAVLSFLETSVAALRLFKLKELAATTKSYDFLFQNLENHPHRVLITVLFANSLTDVSITAVTTYIMSIITEHLHLAGILGFVASIMLVPIIILIFGEIIPKNLAKARGEKLFRSSLWITNFIFYLFYPLVTFLMRFSDYVIASISGPVSQENGSEWVSSEKEIQFLIDYIAEKGLIEKDKTEMLQNIFQLGQIPVKDIMIPASKIVSVPAQLTITETLDVFLEHNFSRLPVWDINKDNIIGMIHLKDIFAALSKNQNKPLKELIRPLLFVPEIMKVNALLQELRQQHMHIAVVLNEHGVIMGLITLEDVLEEIVGDIRDEHEQKSR